MRRSSRNSTSMRASAASALADLAARKASGTTRTADYEVDEADDVFEKVDEQTYAAIAAQRRKEARDFIATGDDDQADEDGGAAMEVEFEMEDDFSVMNQDRDRKRKRTSAPRLSNRSIAPTKRVSSSFFNSFHAAPKANIVEEAEDGANGVIDTSMLDAEHAKEFSTRKAARRKRKMAVQRSVGDLLFDDPNIAPTDDPSQIPIPAAPPVLLDPENDYAAPPPSVKPVSTALQPVPSPSKPPVIPSPTPKVEPVSNPILEDSLDADVLMAAADAAVNRRGPTSAPSVPRLMPYVVPPSNQATSVFPTIPANAPLARDNAGNIMMFWTDAHDIRVNGGQHLYIFGKVPVHHLDSGVFASICVHVQGMERIMYVLPRKKRLDDKRKPTLEPVKVVPDVHAEVTSALLGKSVGKATSLGGLRSGSNLPTAIKAKKVMRSCPFADDFAPREPTEYLKVKIPYSNMNKLQPDSSGSTYSRVFGTRTSASEAFCMKRKLKGPAWISLSNATPLQNNVTHAKFAFSIPNPTDVTISTELVNRDAPPLSTLCVNIKTILNAKSGAHELVMISGIFIREVPLSGPLQDGALEPGGPVGTRDFVIVRPPDGKSVPFGFTDRARSMLARGGGLEVMPNEPALLNNFLTKVLRFDPDVIVGHDILGFGLDVLLARMSVRRSREWSRLGRLIQRRDLTQVVKNNSSAQWFKSEAVAGRLVLDTYSHAKELLFREKDYSLSALSQSVLASAGGQAVVLPPSTDVSIIANAFESTDSLCRLVSECSMEARTAGRLAAHLSVLPLTRQLTCISGNLWSHTMRGARAERIEYLLCHEFKLIGSKRVGAIGKAGDIEGKLLLPDKLSKADRSKIADEVERQRVAASPPAAPNTEYGYGGGAGDERREKASKAAQSGKPKSSRRKPQYSGGLVLEPRRGFYDRYVLQLDFNSLYPSIIQEFNICFTTLHLNRGGSNGDKAKIVKVEDKGDDGDGSGDASTAPDGIEKNESILSPPSGGILEGVLPRVLRRLVEQRRQVKKMLKEERQRAGKESLRAQQLDIRQLAIKLTANSLYGCLGFEGSRFFARPLAEMVTCQGRDTLQKTVDVAREDFNAQVIYGDTDSLFVYTGLEDIALVRKLGMELKRDVNKKYKTLEIEIDAIYKKMLLLKKKKYAALKVVDPTNPDQVVREVKGLDLVRHDWCDLSHDASEHFLTQIFRGCAANVDDAVGNILSFLSELAAKVSNNQISLSKYVITRALTKRPQDYPDGTSLPHVTVANRLISEQGKRIKPGDYIKYVVCVPAESKTSSSSGNVSARSYHPEEVVASKGKLVIDVKYYLENQVLPPIMRLCEPIESIEASRVAVSLGLDGRRYERKEDGGEDGNYLALGPQSAAERFRDVDPMMMKCDRCGAQNELTGVVFASGKAVKASGLECVKCLGRFGFGALTNAVTLTLRGWISKYYTTPLHVNGDDGRRCRETRDIGLGGNSAQAKRRFDEAWLYKQLRYAHFVMDVGGRWGEICKDEERKLPVASTDAKVYESLLDKVDRVFDANAYRFIDVSQFLVTLSLS